MNMRRYVKIDQISAATASQLIFCHNNLLLLLLLYAYFIISMSRMLKQADRPAHIRVPALQHSFLSAYMEKKLEKSHPRRPRMCFSAHPSVMTEP